MDCRSGVMTTKVRPLATAVDPASPPPTFVVTTDRGAWEVEVASDPLLFHGSLAPRRAAANFAASGSRQTSLGTQFQLPAPAWAQLRRHPALYYRARGSSAGPPAVTDVTVDDASVERAPAIHVGHITLPPGPAVSSGGRWLRTIGNTVIDERGSLVVLRGVNHSAFEAAANPALAPADVETMVGGWRANLVRLPIRQHAALADRTYIKALDRAVRTIARRGAYTLLALRRLDNDRTFGTRNGQPTLLAPLPEENSLRLWRTLASRYRREPSVLFDIFTAPHRPLADDGTAVFRPPPDGEDWALRWSAWARRIILAMQRVHPQALTVVSGFDWGTSLRALPIVGTGGRPLRNVIYAMRAFPGSAVGDERAAPAGADDVPGALALRLGQPILVAEWGGGPGDVPWGSAFERGLRRRHVPEAARWGGVAGWGAWSWTAEPALTSPAGPTAFGTVVRDALALRADAEVTPVGIHAPVQPPRWRLELTETTGGPNATNRRADVRALQERLIELRFLGEEDAEAERPADAGPATIPSAQLAKTIAAVKALQGAAGIAPADGKVTPAGKTAKALNRMLPKPTADELTAIGEARDAVTATRVRGVAITTAVGKVTGGNLPADVRAVQDRLAGLGYLAADHDEAPAAGATAAIPAADLTATRTAIQAFRTAEIAYWVKKGVVAGGQTAEAVRPDDATHRLLRDISSWTVNAAEDDPIAFRDYPKSPFTVNVHGVSVSGIAMPEAMPEAEFTTLGFDAAQTRALRFVSAHEGNFDAVNTYDRARISFGFIQFAGGRGLPLLMALAKTTRPEAFAQAFGRYGIDVEFDVRDGAIADPALALVDPDGTVRRGRPAEEAIRDSGRLTGIFIAAGREHDVQVAQMDAAGRYYLVPALTSDAEFTTAVIEVLDAPGGDVIDTRAGAAARAFAATPEYAALETAQRIARRGAGTEAPLSLLLRSEQGLAVLLDRTIQEGSGPAGAGVGRIVGAVRQVADARGVIDVLDVAPYERSILNQVVEDFSADIDIAAALDQASDALKTVLDAAAVAGATLATLTARAELGTARSAVDRAIGHVARKSHTTVANKDKWRVRSRLEARLPPLRAELDLAPAPASVAALKEALTGLRTRLGNERPPAADAAIMRARVRAILAGGLAAPPAEPT